jgi:hypothetical protein
MELLFLLGLLFVVIYFNRGLLGFGPKGCDWMSADDVNENGEIKWMCGTHGTVAFTKTRTPPPNCE